MAVEASLSILAQSKINEGQAGKVLKSTLNFDVKLNHNSVNPSNDLYSKTFKSQVEERRVLFHGALRNSFVLYLQICGS